MEDEKIVEMYLARDEAALTATAEKYGGRLRALAYGIVKDSGAAEECENDTYLKAWDSIPPHEPRAYLYPFLARITRHCALNLCRDRGRLKRSAHIAELTREMEQCLPAPDNAEQRLDDTAFAAALNGFLASVAEEKRNIFLRRYWYLDSIADIARRFGVSESKIKSALSRMRTQLKKHLEKEGYQI